MALICTSGLWIRADGQPGALAGNTRRARSASSTPRSRNSGCPGGSAARSNRSAQRAVKPAVVAASGPSWAISSPWARDQTSANRTGPSARSSSYSSAKIRSQAAPISAVSQRAAWSTTASGVASAASTSAPTLTVRSRALSS